MTSVYATDIICFGTRIWPQYFGHGIKTSIYVLCRQLYPVTEAVQFECRQTRHLRSCPTSTHHNLLLQSPVDNIVENRRRTGTKRSKSSSSLVTYFQLNPVTSKESKLSSSQQKCTMHCNQLPFSVFQLIANTEREKGFPTRYLQHRNNDTFQ